MVASAANPSNDRFDSSGITFSSISGKNSFTTPRSIMVTDTVAVSSMYFRNLLDTFDSELFLFINGVFLAVISVIFEINELARRISTNMGKRRTHTKARRHKGKGNMLNPLKYIYRTAIDFKNKTITHKEQ